MEGEYGIPYSLIPTTSTPITQLPASALRTRLSPLHVIYSLPERAIAALYRGTPARASTPIPGNVAHEPRQSQTRDLRAPQYIN